MLYAIADLLEYSAHYINMWLIAMLQSWRVIWPCMDAYIASNKCPALVLW